MADAKKIAITGGAGQIAYQLLFRIGSGGLYGPDQPISLHILELPSALDSLRGVVMELEDCSFPLIEKIEIGSDPYKIFDGVETLFLLGSKPRTAGMERKELLIENGAIFIEQGKALEKVTPPSLLTLVVGNPCNTNALITRAYSRRERCFAMSMLDQNRATAMLASHARVPLSAITHMVVWGNHSSTQVADFINAKIFGRGAIEVVRDRSWLEERFVPQIQQRGAAVIAARGKSSAASAAEAALKAMRSLIYPTPPGEFFSMAVYSDGNSYGIEKGLFFSFPCYSIGEGIVQIVPGLYWDNYLREKILISERELVEERSMIEALLP